jgi:hypothetical protein
MREIGAEPKALKLYGMASAWGDLSVSGNDVGIEGSRWLIEQLLDAESADRAMRSIRWQMSSARFPLHRDLAGFNFEQSCVDRKLIGELSEFSFSDDAHNVVLVVDPVLGNRTWPLRWASAASLAMGDVCVSSPLWTWSTHWSGRRLPVRLEDWHCCSAMSIWSFWTSLAICPSVNQAVPCSSTFFRNSMSIPAS